jgi:predicted ATP-dependent protease
MDFILKSQARAEARVGQAEERQARTDEQLGQLSFRLEALADLHRNLVQVATQTFEAQARINESSRAAERSLRAAMTELAERQASADRRLETLINIVGEGRGGGG